jgi:hypothetical protein
MDPVIIATSVVTWLVPYLAQAGESVTKKIGERFYAAIKARVEDKPSAKEAINDLEKAPTDEDAQAAMRVQLKKLLTEDSAFAAEVEKLLQAAEATGANPSISAKDRSIAAGRDVSGTIISGDVKGSITIDRPHQKKKP